MPKVTEAHLEARREQILGAAFACFSRQGFHQTTMQDICLEAGLSPGAIYRYFASKEEIIEASCEGCEQGNLAISESGANGAGAIELLDELAGKAFGELDDPDAIVGLRVQVQWWSEAIRSPRLGESLRRTTIDPLRTGLAQIIGRGQKRSQINPDLDAESAARVLLSMWQGFVLQKALDPVVDVQPYLEVVKAMYGGTFWVENRNDNGVAEPASST